jgi:hypothetical protein
MTNSNRGAYGRAGGSGELSHVAMTFYRCPVCGIKHTQGVAFHRRLAQVLPREVQEGWSLCDEHKAEAGSEWVWLCGVSGEPGSGAAALTGESAKMRREAARRVFNIDTDAAPFCWIEPGAMEKLRALMRDVEGGASC